MRLLPGLEHRNTATLTPSFRDFSKEDAVCLQRLSLMLKHQTALMVLVNPGTQYNFVVVIRNALPPEIY